MINSLSKDSHIPQYFRLPKLDYHPRGNTKINQSKPDGTGATKRGYREKITVPAQMKNSSILINKPAEPSFSGFSNANKFNIHTSKWAKKFFKMAAENQVVFNAFFSLALTCILRPAAIMSLPGKKNKDDKKYAAAHSMASGVIGYALASMIFNPIKKGAEKIAKNPELFLKKNAAYLKDKVNMDVAKTYMKMIPENIVAPGRAIITVALIPPILKYVFGWEKKSKSQDKNVGVPLLENYAVINFKSNQEKSKKVFQSFTGEKN